ncbi:MAG: protein kinase domain-containing protein, partial [Stellaceae bacterium]
IKPDNVILEGGGAFKLIDLGVVRVPGLEEFPAENIPGTAAYMAPEMAAGEPGNEATDIYALGATLYRAFTGEYPYANQDATSPPRRSRPMDFSTLRPDLPAWLQAALARAIAADPAQRFGDMTELALALEAGPARAPDTAPRPLTLYERAPLRVWQAIAALLALALLAALLLR